MYKKGLSILASVGAVLLGLALIIAIQSFTPAPPAHAASALKFVNSNTVNNNTTNGALSPFNGPYGSTRGQFATSSYAYLTPGTGTTTVVAYTADAEQLGLNVSFFASSSASILKYRYEYSNDYVNWYSQTARTNTSATTTILSQSPAEYTFEFANNTGSASSTSSYYFFHDDLLNVASTYVRVVLYVPIGAANGGVNAQIAVKSANPI